MAYIIWTIIKIWLLWCATCIMAISNVLIKSSCDCQSRSWLACWGNVIHSFQKERLQRLHISQMGHSDQISHQKIGQTNFLLFLMHDCLLFVWGWTIFHMWNSSLIKAGQMKSSSQQICHKSCPKQDMNFQMMYPIFSHLLNSSVIRSDVMISQIDKQQITTNYNLNLWLRWNKSGSCIKQEVYAGLQDELSALRKQLTEAKTAAALAQARGLVSSAKTVGPNNAKYIVARLDNIDAKAMQVEIQYMMYLSMMIVSCGI